jgi:predicted TIM-barrel fold metal-dependent hydrolase
MKRLIKDNALLLRLNLNRLNKPKNIYQGRLIDAMMQINSQVSAADIKTKMDAAGVDTMMLFARQQEPFEATQHVLNIKKELGSMIVLGAPKRFDQKETLTDSFVKELTDGVNSNTYKFIGELQLSHADKWPPTSGNEVTLRGERYVNALSPGMIKLMDNLRGKGVPVFIHWETYEWERDWPQFTKLFSKYPDINFVWPHGGYAQAKIVNEVLNRHKNVYVTLSKRDLFYFDHKWRTYTGEDIGAYGLSNLKWQDKLGGSMLDNNGKINAEWFYLIQRFPDKFMFATDCHKMPRWGHYLRIVEIWREILGLMPEDMAENVAYKNAVKLFSL